MPGDCTLNLAILFRNRWDLSCGRGKRSRFGTLGCKQADAFFIAVFIE